MWLRRRSRKLNFDKCYIYWKIMEQVYKFKDLLTFYFKNPSHICYLSWYAFAEPSTFFDNNVLKNDNKTNVPSEKKRERRTMYRERWPKMIPAGKTIHVRFFQTGRTIKSHKPIVPSAEEAMAVIKWSQYYASEYNTLKNWIL